MNKFFMGMVLMGASVSAFADWELAGALKDLTMRTYVDFDTLKVRGNMRTIWIMDVFSEAQKVKGYAPYKSMATRVEVNCDKDISRVTSMAVYSEDMGQGETIFKLDLVDDWVSFPPHSMAAARMKAICIGKVES